MFVKIRLLLGQWLTAVAKHLGHRLYFLLALLLSVLIVLDANTAQLGMHLQNNLFDYLLKHRSVKPQTDQDILIIDIDQSSVTDLSNRLGQQPWSKQVFGELVEHLASKQARSIVFDLTFHHTDSQHTAGDYYFSEAISQQDNIYFPIQLLDASKDFSSAITYTSIPSAIALASANKTATLAAQVPYFMEALGEKQLGMNNINADFDGIVRTYKSSYKNQGWEIPALAKLVGQSMDTNVQNIPNTLFINWRDLPYQHLSFSEVYENIHADTASTANIFANKIILIGTSADQYHIKKTILDSQFTNTELLATTIDNIMHQDFLKVWKSKLMYLGLSLALVWLTAFMFYYHSANTWVFSLGMLALFIASYIALNVANTYLAIAVPILWAFAFFIPAKLYEMLTTSKLQRWLSFGSHTKSEQLSALVMPVLIDGLEKPLSDRQIRKIKQSIQVHSKTPCEVDMVKGIQSGIWGFFGDMLVINWTVSTKSAAYLASAKADAANVINSLANIKEVAGLQEDTFIRHTLHETTINQANNTTLELAAQWRTILATAILKLEQQPETTSTDHDVLLTAVANESTE